MAMKDGNALKRYMDLYLSDPENFDAVKLGCEREIREACKLIEAKRDANIELAQMLNEIGVAVSNELKTSDVKWISAYLEWTNGVVKRLSEPTRKKLKISFFNLEKKVDLSSEADAAAIRFILTKIKEMSIRVNEMNITAKDQWRGVWIPYGRSDDQVNSARLERAYRQGRVEHLSLVISYVSTLKAVFFDELKRVQEKAK